MLLRTQTISEYVCCYTKLFNKTILKHHHKDNLTPIGKFTRNSSEITLHDHFTLCVHLLVLLSRWGSFSIFGSTQFLAIAITLVIGNFDCINAALIKYLICNRLCKNLPLWHIYTLCFFIKVIVLRGTM